MLCSSSSTDARRHHYTCNQWLEETDCSLATKARERKVTGGHEKAGRRETEPGENFGPSTSSTSCFYHHCLRLEQRRLDRELEKERPKGGKRQKRATNGGKNQRTEGTKGRRKSQEREKRKNCGKNWGKTGRVNRQERERETNTDEKKAKKKKTEREETGDRKKTAGERRKPVFIPRN
jgi:hypothetical protein